MDLTGQDILNFTHEVSKNKDLSKYIFIMDALYPEDPELPCHLIIEIRIGDSRKTIKFKAIGLEHYPET